MNEEIIQKLAKKFTKDIKVDISVIPPIGATFLRKYSTNGTIPLATFASLITFTLSYFIGSALTNTRAESQNIHGYVITASILSSFLILSLILNSWYRAIAKNKKIGTELLNSDLNKGDKGEIDKIKIILDFRGGRTLEYVVPVNLSQIDELKQQIRENQYRIILLSIPIVIPILTLMIMLVANGFNMKNLYIGVPVLILFSSISFVKLGFTLCKAKENKMNDCTFSQFSNKDILLNFGSKSSKITIINEQFKKQDIDKKKDEKAVENNEDEYCYNEDLNEKECSPSITRSSSSGTMYSITDNSIDNTNERDPLITVDKQKEPGSWFGSIGKALGGQIALTMEQAICAATKTCKDISSAAQKVEQMGSDVSELKVPIKQMCKDVSSATTQLRQTSKDVSKAAKQVEQTSIDISRFIRKVKSYLPSEDDNTYLAVSLEDILPILKSKLKAKDDKNDLDDTINNLVDGKVIVSYKNGSTLEFTLLARRADAKEKIGCFTELRVEDLKMTVGKNGFVFDSKINT